MDGLSKKYPNMNSSTLWQITKMRYGVNNISTSNKATGTRTRGYGYTGNAQLYANGQNPYPQQGSYTPDDENG